MIFSILNTVKFYYKLMFEHDLQIT